jgi:glycosyltransferase involved in cell wall biosynthesis
MQKQKQTILMLMDWFLPGTKSGGPVRSYANMIAYLGDYYNFKIITRDTDYCETETYTSVKSDAWNHYNAHTQIYYISKDKQTKAQLKQLIENTAYDQLYISGIYSWYFSILPLLLRSQQVPTLVAPRGMLNPQAFSVKPLKKKVYIALAKAFNLYKNVTFHVTNTDEAAQVKSRLGDQAVVHIAPNFPRKMSLAYKSQTEINTPKRFVSIARISVEKGTHHLIKALIGLEHPIVLDLYGPIYDEAYWEKCKTLIKKLPATSQVHYKGVVASDEIPTLLKRYDVFTLLSEGENFGHAILEAFAAGCPVIISNRTPWNNLETQHIGWDVDLSDAQEINRTFIKAITMNPNEYQRWSKNAVDFAVKFSENPELLQSNIRLFENQSGS